MLRFALLLVLAAGLRAEAQPARGWATPDTLFADYQDRFAHVPRDAPQAGYRRGAPATFEVEYVGFPAEARAAVQLALDIWSEHLQSSVPIRVLARWEAADDENVLGSTAPRIIANFERAPNTNTWYAVALANALFGRDLDPDEPHIRISFNSAFDRWYFGTDGRPPSGQFDLATIALHELGHGLGFVGSMTVEDGLGTWGFAPSSNPSARFPVIYDRFAERGDGTSLLNEAVFPRPSEALAAALTSEDLFFDGPAAIRAAEGERPRLHAPPEWQPGSSYSHLSEQRVAGVEVYYPPGSPNALMTPTVGSAEAIHDPGPIVCGMFEDLGWALGPGCEVLLAGFAGFTARADGGDVVLTFRLGDDTGFDEAVVEQGTRRGPGPGEPVVFEPVEAGAVAVNPDEGQAYTVELPGTLGPGVYTFRLRLVRDDGSAFLSEPVTVTVAGEGLVLNVFPNPAADFATIEVVAGVSRVRDVEVTVYDVLGRRVAELFDGDLASGSGEQLTLSARGLAAGVYFVRARSGEGVVTRSLTVVR